MDKTSDAIDVRGLRQDELALLVPCWNASGLSIRPLGRDSIEQLTVQWQKNASGFIGAFMGPDLIGAVLASDDGRRGWINRLAVRPAYRHAGIGRRLIAAAEDRLKSRGLQIIAALIEDSNSPSRSLFRSCGYEFLPEVLYYSKRDTPDV